MTAMNELIVARAGWGVVLLAAPSWLPARCRWVLRALGARHVAQAVVTAWRPTPGVLAAGAATDLVHASSMAALALADARWRGRAAADGAAATAFAAAGARAVLVSRTAPEARGGARRKGGRG